MNKTKKSNRKKSLNAIRRKVKNAKDNISQITKKGKGVTAYQWAVLILRTLSPLLIELLRVHFSK